MPNNVGLLTTRDLLQYAAVAAAASALGASLSGTNANAQTAKLPDTSKRDQPRENKSLALRDSHEDHCDDVLWSMSLQPHRVDNGIEEYREGEQRSRHEVDRNAENGDGTSGKDESYYKRFTARDSAARYRTPGRTGHHGIDIGVVPYVERPGGASPSFDTQDCNGRYERIEVTRCNL